MTANHLHTEFAVLDPKDQRCALRKVTPRDGLTLRQAMLFYGDERDADEFRRLEPSRGQANSHMSSDKRNALARYVAWKWPGFSLRSIYQRLLSSLLSKLVAGELHATGYAANSGIDEPAQTIPADRWRTLQADYRDLSGVLVWRYDQRHSRFQAATEGRRSLEEARRQSDQRPHLVQESVTGGCRGGARATPVKMTRRPPAFILGAPRGQWLRELRRELAPPSGGSPGVPSRSV